MITKNYYNLSQCNGDRMVYFRSTDVEQHNYHRLLWSIPDEWFYWLHKGYKIKVIDKSTKTSGKIERIFLPALQDFMSCFYLMKYKLRSPQLNEHINYMYKELDEDRQLETRFDFWKDKIKKVEISGETIQVEKEGNPLDNNRL